MKHLSTNGNAGTGDTITDSRVQALDIVRRRITAYRGLGMPWREISALEEFGGSSAGLLCSILGGYEPRTAETRKRLGLPPLAVPVEPCPDCGEAHTVPWCVEKDGQPVKKKVYNIKRPKRPRASISTENAGSAAKTICGKTSSAFRRELVRILSEDIMENE